MKFVIALLLVLPLAKAHNYLPATKAGTNCTTTCYNLGNQRICNTHCW